MKNFMNRIYQSTRQLGFFQGVALTICLSSLVGIAATNLPGFFVFSPGTTISSSEINANFEKLAGTIVVKASLTTPFSATNGDFVIPSDCPTCKVFRKRINFNSISIGSAALNTTTDNDASSSSEGYDFHYYQVPSDGWYEIRLLGNIVSTVNSATCDANGCSYFLSSGLSVQIANDVTSASLNNTPSIGWLSSTKNAQDNDSDGIFDSTNGIPPYPPEARKIYLKNGQILFVKFDGSMSEQYATTSINAGATSIDLTIIKL